MNNYFISPIAENDIDAAITYIAKESEKAAMTFLDELFKAMGMLAENPLAGHKRSDLTHHPVRFWPFKWHYLIVYKYCNPIEIVRMLSGYRNISTLLN